MKFLQTVFCIALLLSASGAHADGRMSRHERLGKVANWFYFLDFNDVSRMVKRISNSGYDMVVVEPVFTERENTRFKVADMVRDLKGKAGRRLVLAYIDIGEAEEWRSYWKEGWRIGNPKWIVADDPDGWDGNFPVAYWHRGWRDIWLGETGYIEALKRAGFDGIYLDWVEAYSDENIIHAARRDKVKPRREMIRWVQDLAAQARRNRPDFLVIAQNAAELADDPGYARTIDAIAQEQIWFDGGADNKPAGDCPLPELERDIESLKYIRSLSRQCRRQHDRYPDSTLHVSSESYIGLLQRAKKRGLHIFTVDYALKRRNIEKVYRKSRSLGFIPFVSGRALASFRPVR
jgi:cysteinyl-tRNA synthetase